MEQSYDIKKRLEGQRGAVAILFVLCLPVLLGFAALAVDLARLQLVKIELQNAADAAALAGARSLTDPVTSSDPYNWLAASQKAQELAQQNIANGMQIDWADIDTGYWNLQNPALGFNRQETGYVPIPGDVPAVRATISLSATRNNGPLLFFFAPILGIDNSDLQATAIAMIAPPAGGTGLLPFVISKIMLDTFWNLEENKPVMENGEPKELNIGIGSTYFDDEDIDSGTWTTFNNQTTAKNSASYIIKLINGEENSNATFNVNDLVWISSGVKESAYNALPTNIDVAIIVVDAQYLDTGSWQEIYAIAGFHIDNVLVNNEKINGKPYIQGHFIEPTIIANTSPGTGNEISYGAYTPPILVK